MASSLFSLRAWQSSRATSLQVLFVSTNCWQYSLQWCHWQWTATRWICQFAAMPLSCYFPLYGWFQEVSHSCLTNVKIHPPHHYSPANCQRHSHPTPVRISLPHSYVRQVSRSNLTPVIIYPLRGSCVEGCHWVSQSRPTRVIVCPRVVECVVLEVLLLISDGQVPRGSH